MWITLAGKGDSRDTNIFSEVLPLGPLSLSTLEGGCMGLWTLHTTLEAEEKLGRTIWITEILQWWTWYPEIFGTSHFLEIG